MTDLDKLLRSLILPRDEWRDRFLLPFELLLPSGDSQTIRRLGEQYRRWREVNEWQEANK